MCASDDRYDRQMSQEEVKAEVERIVRLPQYINSTSEELLTVVRSTFTQEEIGWAENKLLQILTGVSS